MCPSKVVADLYHNLLDNVIRSRNLMSWGRGLGVGDGDWGSGLLIGGDGVADWGLGSMQPFLPTSGLYLLIIRSWCDNWRKIGKTKIKFSFTVLELY